MSGLYFTKGKLLFIHEKESRWWYLSRDEVQVAFNNITSETFQTPGKQQGLDFLRRNGYWGL